MEVELLEIRDFICQYAPFDQLPEEAILEIVRSIEISYYRADTSIVDFKDDINDPELEKKFDTLIIQIIRDFKLI